MHTKHIQVSHSVIMLSHAQVLWHVRLGVFMHGIHRLFNSSAYQNQFQLVRNDVLFLMMSYFYFGI